MYDSVDFFAAVRNAFFEIQIKPFYPRMTLSLVGDHSRVDAVFLAQSEFFNGEMLCFFCSL